MQVLEKNLVPQVSHRPHQEGKTVPGSVTGAPLLGLAWPRDRNLPLLEAGAARLNPNMAVS